LALLTWPGIVLALLHAPSLHQADVIAEFTKPGTMTFFAVAARLVNLALSLGVIWCVGEMARLVAGRRAGLFAAGACALNFGLTYYGQVSNLDVPYLFWGSLSLLTFMRAAAERQPRRLWLAVLSAAAAIATKDQAYGLFLLSLPVFLFLWLAAVPRAQGREILRRLLPAAAVGLSLLLLVDGAISNPGGFVQRLHFLAGPASADYATYPRSWDGLLAVLSDMAVWFGEGYAAPAVLLALLGLGLRARRGGDRDIRIAGLLPAFAILSFILCFNFAALRSDARFLLPQAVLACIYIGIAASWLISASNRWTRLAASAGITVVALLALHHCLAVSVAMLQDPRYDAEAWMRVHVRPGDVIETYGQNAYLPRFPEGAAVLRAGMKPPKARNPLHGVTEVQEPFDKPRASRFIVVNDWWLRHYTEPQSELGGHRTPSRAQAALYGDAPARAYFQALKDGRLAYRLAYAASPVRGIWPAVHIHESLNETVLIFERVS
jgi:asparagine N-glycosylation enzyme membrane subunit Stt3